MLEFGNRLLFVPHRVPQFDSYKLWTDIIPLCNQDFYYLGTFLFEPRSGMVKLK